MPAPRSHPQPPPSDNPMVPIPIADRKDDLDRIAAYAFPKPPLTWLDKLIYFAIAIFTLLSPITYIRPAYKDHPFEMPDTPALKWIDVVAAWIPITYIFFSADMDFLRIRAANIIPPVLNDILKGMTKEQIRRQDWTFGIISALSGVPLTTPLLEYPIYGAIGNIFLAPLILIANLIAHLRPLQAISTDPQYGANLINWVIRIYNERGLSAEQKSANRAKEQKIAVNAKLKADWINTLTAKKELLLDSCFIRNPRGGGYELRQSNEFKRIFALQNGSLITELMAYNQTSPVSDSHNTSRSYEIFLSTIGQIGALWVVGESVGYFQNSGLTLSRMTRSDAIGWSLAAVPIFVFAVLMHMVGRENFRNNIDFAIGFVLGKKSLSWPLKYCYRIYLAACFIPNLVLSYMTPGSANTMIRTDLSDRWGKENTEIYISVFRWALVALIFFLLPAMENYIFSRWAKYFDTDDAKQIVEFDERIERINTLLPKWQDERFLEQAPPSIFPPSAPETPPTSVAQPRRTWCEWFCRRSSRPEKVPLLGSLTA